MVYYLYYFLKRFLLKRFTLLLIMCIYVFVCRCVQVALVARTGCQIPWNLVKVVVPDVDARNKIGVFCKDRM